MAPEVVAMAPLMVAVARTVVAMVPEVQAMIPDGIQYLSTLNFIVTNWKYMI